MSAPSNPDDLRLALDACRADSNDLALSELAPLAERLPHDASLAAELVRSHAFDRRVRQSLNEVSLPAGLEVRMLAGLNARESTSEQHVDSLPTPVSHGLNRRLLRLALMATAAVALCALTVGHWNRRPLDPLSDNELVSTADAVSATVEQNAAWRTDLTHAMLKQYPYASFLRSSHTPRGWCATKLAEERAVAYDLTPPEAGKAVLLVVQTRRTYDLPPMPYKRISTSGKLAIGAWQQQGRLYLLVVEAGGLYGLEDFLPPQSFASR